MYCSVQSISECANVRAPALINNTHCELLLDRLHLSHSWQVVHSLAFMKGNKSWLLFWERPECVREMGEAVGMQSMTSWDSEMGYPAVALSCHSSPGGHFFSPQQCSTG